MAPPRVCGHRAAPAMACAWRGWSARAQWLCDSVRHLRSEKPSRWTSAVSPRAASSAVWIGSSVRLFALVWACLEHDEPVLLVGETGTGKTTVCQLCAEAASQRLQMINCHQHTETADFIGGLRPARGRSFQVEALAEKVLAFEGRVAPAAAALAATGAAPPTPPAEAHVESGAMDVADLPCR